MLTVPPLVVKIGGALVGDPGSLEAFWDGVVALRTRAPVVVVHGGGPQATALARRLGHEPRMVHGRRVTTDLDLSIIQWALCGELNTQLVARAQQHGLRAVGVNGASAGLVRVEKRPPWVVDGETVDFGWVGDVKGVEGRALEALLSAGLVPVVAPLGIDGVGQVYNVNADTVARSIAEALGAAELLLVTEAGHVRRDPESPESYLPTCDAALFAQGKQEGWIQGGMRVKLQVAFEALSSGVAQVHILAPDDLQHRTKSTRVVN